jgi:transcriptional regulator with XRE-family HTH domain
MLPETKTIPLGQRRKLLRRFREQYGITLDEFGPLAELSTPMLSQFENGGRDLSPEAWTRVLAAVDALVNEANAKRLAEIEKAKKTAAKLGTPLSLDFFGDMLKKIEEQAAEEQAEIARQIEFRSLFIDALDEQKAVLATQIAQMPKEEIVKQYCALWASANKLNQELRDLEARGYALFLKSDVEAKDKRIAELEQSK